MATTKTFVDSFDPMASLWLHTIFSRFRSFVVREPWYSYDSGGYAEAVMADSEFTFAGWSTRVVFMTPDSKYVAKIQVNFVHTGTNPDHWMRDNQRGSSGSFQGYDEYHASVDFLPELSEDEQKNFVPTLAFGWMFNTVPSRTLRYDYRTDTEYYDTNRGAIISITIQPYHDLEGTDDEDFMYEERWEAAENYGDILRRAGHRTWDLATHNVAWSNTANRIVAFDWGL